MVVNDRGMAMVETLPILVVFLVLLYFGLGFFGAVHTAVLNSIAARTYAFETFRNRTNLDYFRDRGVQGADQILYVNIGNRTHLISDEIDVLTGDVSRLSATSRDLAIGRDVESANNSVLDHNQRIFEIGRRNRELEISPIWVMVAYGICLDAECGDRGRR